jgi:hypothetical protein
MNDRVRLLYGPYRQPALNRGDRTHCLVRDRDVVITGWSNARIPWPRCRALGTHGGGSGLLVDEELARAIRSESAAALRYWWGVGEHAVWHWRRELGVSRTSNPGSQRLIQAASEAGASVTRGKPLGPAEVERRRQTAQQLNLGQHLRPAIGGPRWTAEQVAMLGVLPDAEVAQRTGRSSEAVRLKRWKLGIPWPDY